VIVVGTAAVIVIADRRFGLAKLISGEPIRRRSGHGAGASGKVALVTGASRGIGLAIADGGSIPVTLAAAGMRSKPAG
jgi:hypothetical protein